MPYTPVLDPYRGIRHNDDPVLGGVANLAAALFTAPVRRRELEMAEEDKQYAREAQGAERLFQHGQTLAAGKRADRGLDLQEKAGADRLFDQTADREAASDRANQADLAAADRFAFEQEMKRAADARAGEMDVARIEGLNAEAERDRASATAGSQGILREAQIDPYQTTYAVEKGFIVKKRTLKTPEQVQAELQVRRGLRDRGPGTGVPNAGGPAQHLFPQAGPGAYAPNAAGDRVVGPGVMDLDGAAPAGPDRRWVVEQVLGDNAFRLPPGVLEALTGDDPAALDAALSGLDPAVARQIALGYQRQGR